MPLTAAWSPVVPLARNSVVRKDSKSSSLCWGLVRAVRVDAVILMPDASKMPPEHPRGFKVALRGFLGPPKSFFCFPEH